eukprot:CAMPEP_0113563172 /NCGR_PEP_ID=MMETSP0015_2-20120614/20921_1 /TAXON_ID=2838 /ORGANISM="Odontella" /LENGTH=1025 /DNA_ID=CAMNT_0000465123 /DNA_START=145 /DNA_END=3223 /DNA_ORIENTATION=+ /assembly_acc=CAM_ASM_000160
MALQARFSGRAAALAALYASALCLNDAGAFTPTALLQSSSGNRASSVASSCAPFLSSCPTHGASALSGGGGGGGTGTALSMNFVDEFVSSTDLKTRKADNDRYLSTLNGRIERINGLESTIEELGDDELAAKSVEFRKRLADGEDVNGPIVEEAFAVVREAAWRVIEQRHYDVQLIGGLVLHDGRLAEMATGEGKTLVATLPCYLNALTGQPSFVITVNDYLARRDMEKMGQVHRFLGLTVGLIQSGMTEEERREAYSCDVVYVTNSELGFDYLRDHLALSPGQTVLPSAGSGSGEVDGFCVVDEADSVLIDEARTPLIISKQVPAPSEKYSVAKTLADALTPGIHYEVDEKNKNVVLDERGYRDCERALGIDSLFAVGPDGSAWAPYVTNAVKAKELFSKDIEYTVLEDGGEMVGVGIIDSFTGRVLDGRRWSDGLHQSIEAKEGIAVSEQSQVIAKVTYQSLFRQFSRLSGMTGTAMSDANELEGIYGIKVTPVPTALPVARRDYPDVAFKTRRAANDALVREIVNVGGGQPDGRPCLVGTTSVQQSEQIVAALAENGIATELLNALPANAARESEIIAQAGRAGVVTVATNMAGRGTDVLLGGCPSTMARIKVRAVLVDQGVIGEDAASILPPTPPEEYFPCALDEDTTFVLKDAGASIKKALGTGMTALELDELLTVATDTTESEEDPEHIIKLRDAAEIVKDAYKEVLSEEKEKVVNNGGLYVMGTNRHESSRIDGQLRGRSGRQGDPGTSRFFLSFEDDMFVVFGGDGLQNILKTFRVSEDMPVEAPQVTDALDKVQGAVEEKYREIREQILNFDEVLNGQRKVIYQRRQKVLFGSSEDTLKLMEEYNRDTVADIVKAQSSEDGETVDVDKVLEKVGQFFPPVRPVLDKGDLEGLDQEGVTAFVGVAVEEIFKSKMDELDAKAGQPGSLARSANYITMVSMDNAWSEHLQNMENLKESVVFLKYMGRDIVAEYKSEAYNMFQGLEDKMRFNSIYSLWQSLGAPAAQQLRSNEGQMVGKE